MPGSHFILKKISIDILQSAAVKRDLSASLKPATLHNKDNRESTSTEYHSTGVMFTHHLTTRITYM